MINLILSSVINFVMKGIEVILTPIDNYITANIPSFAEALTKLNNFVDYLINVIKYAIDLTGLSPFAIGLIVSYLTFALTVPLVFWGIKTVVKWWHMLVP